MIHPEDKTCDESLTCDCRLIDFGMSVGFSRRIGVTYEKYFHRYLLKKDKALWNSKIKKYW